MPAPKYEHEIRDPIHTFIRVSSDERRVIDSRSHVPSAGDLAQAADPIGAVDRAARDRFPGCVEKDVHAPASKPMEVAVDKDGTIVSSVAESQILGHIPTARFGYVFITPEKLDEGTRWLRENIRGILENAVKESP